MSVPAAGPTSLAGRTALVTGAYGLLGGWLVRALLDERVRVVAIRRDEPTCSALEMLGLAGRVNVVHGDICEPEPDRPGAERVRGRQRLSPRRADARSDGQPGAAVHF